MERLVEETYTFSRKDNQTHVSIPFRIDARQEKLVIKFAYSPQQVEQGSALEEIEKALLKYIPKEELPAFGDTAKFLPLENLITLSLDYEGKYIGCHHHKSNQQEVVVSKEISSKGYIKQEVAAGTWEIQLNLHCIASETVQLHITVDAVRQKEEVR